MPVTNVVLKSLEARRYQDQPPGGQLRVDHNSHIGLVQAEGPERLRVEFAFTTGYGALGVIKLEGNLWLQEPQAEDLAKTWAETRNLPQDIAQQVHGAILGNCVPDAVGLAKQVRLPPPIPMPQVQIGKGSTAKAAGPGDSPEIG